MDISYYPNIRASSKLVLSSYYRFIHPPSLLLIAIVVRLVPIMSYSHNSYRVALIYIILLYLPRPIAISSLRHPVFRYPNLLFYSPLLPL